MSKLRYLVLISIVPILYFISKTECDKNPDVLSNSLVPFLTFILGFYLYKINIFQDTSGIFLIFGIQLISSLTYLITISLLLSKIITLFRKTNMCIVNFKWCKKDDIIQETDKEFLLKTLDLTKTLNESMIDRLNPS